LGDKTPEEDFTSVKPKVSHLRIFGFPVYIHMSQGEKDEVGAFWEEGDIFGYNETSKAYKIYIPGQRQIEVS
jgi:hypothetical protein